jgi:hypothetical protein
MADFAHFTVVNEISISERQHIVVTRDQIYILFCIQPLLMSIYRILI